jgi:hypothetical protein
MLGVVTIRTGALRGLGALVSLLATAAPVGAQGGAIDPLVAPRASALIRQGERRVATDMLGRYLAIAQEDGRAWLQMGRIYLLDARDWHAQHEGEPDATLYLEFAGASLEMAGRFIRDSGAVFRGMVEMERATIMYEDSGWVATQRSFVARGLPLLPPAMQELGDNLLASCPSGGILVTGGDTETLSAWYAALLRTSREPVVPVRPDLYVTDETYRERTAKLLNVDPRLPLRDAIKAAASRRPVCVTPSADSAAVPAMAWRVSRLVRLSRGETPRDAALSFTAFLEQERGGPSEWVIATREVYERAARFNPQLCPALTAVFAGAPPVACRP